MKRRLPPEAFGFYVGQGRDRSYQSVADRYGVAKRTVTTHAAREHWQERAAEADRKIAAEAEQRAVEGLAEVQKRHLRTLRTIQARALEGLRAVPITGGASAVRALLLAIREERMVLGSSMEDVTITIE